MSADAFGPDLMKLTETHRIVGIDLLGHGHTALGSRKIIPAEIGDDLTIVFEGYWPEHAAGWPGINNVTKYILSNTRATSRRSGC